MTLEILRGKSPYIYRIDPADTTVIQMKENRHNARWQRYLQYTSREDAQAGLLRLETGTEGKDRTHDL